MRYAARTAAPDALYILALKGEVLRVTLIKEYPFEVLIHGNRSSVVLADQVKSLDWRARKATFKGKISAAELSEIRRKALSLLG